MDFGIASVAAITVICYLVGLIVKSSGLDHKYITALYRPPGFPGHGPADRRCCGHCVRSGGNWCQPGYQADEGITTYF